MASWQELEPHLTALLELTEQQRSARLQALSEAQPQLADELRALLRAADQTRWEQQMAGAAAGDVIASLADSLARDQDRSGQVIDRYRLGRLLGQGGMGAVYLAQRADGAFEQTAALKLLPGRTMNSAVGERFVRERQILARLSHPNIARLLDGGVTNEGNPYFVLEYVDGTSITDYCDANRLDLTQRLALFAKLLSAVSFAHANLVVHGDLKPDNVLVTATGELKLLDFGIATALDRANETAVALTPNYASPEQLAGAPVTALTDIYSLGALLYRVLAGRVPYDYAGMSLDAIRAAAMQPQYPALQPTALIGRKAEELDSILRRALRPEPALRYASVADFRADLDRLIAQQPVLAHPNSRGYRAKKFLQRHRLGVTASALFVAGIAVSMVAVTTSAQRATLEAARAERISTFLQSLFDAANPFGAWKEEKTVSDLLQYAATRYQRDLADDPVALAQVQDMLGVAFLGNGEYERAVALLTEALSKIEASAAPDSAVVAQAHNHLAHALIESGSYEAAQVHAGRARDIYTDLGPDHALSLADALTNLAVATSNLGDRAGSETLHTRALALRTARLPAEDTRIADSKMSLASARAAQGKTETVIALNEAAHTIYVAQFGADHPLAVRAMNGVASGAFLTRDYPRAAQAFSELVTLSESRLGSTHPELALPLNNLGRVLTETGEFAAADEALARAEALLEQSEGKQMLAASVLFNRATLLAELGAFSEAQTRLDASGAAFAAIVGEAHPLTARVAIQRALALVLRGELERAALIVQPLLAAADTGAQARSTAALVMARIDNTAARYDKAMTELETAFAVLSESMPQDSWRYADLQLQRALAARNAAEQARWARELRERLPAISVRRQLLRSLPQTAGETGSTTTGG